MLELKGNAVKREAALAGAMCCVAAAFGFYRMRFGLGLGDEGHVLSAPVRYALGDLPFRDEVLNPLRWFDILMWPVMRALPEGAGLLWLRGGSFAVNILCLCALLFAVRRRLPVIALAGVFAASIYSNFWTVWTPTYHTAMADFILLGAVLWISGAEAEGRRAGALLGAGAGVAFFLAAVCEAPGAALLVVPAAFAVFSPRGRGGSEGLRISSVSLVCAACFLMSLALAALVSSGLSPDLLEAIKIQQTIVAYKGGYAWLLKVGYGLWYAAPYCAGHAAAFWIVFRLFRLGRLRGNAYYAAGAAAVAVYMAVTAAFVVSSFGPAAYADRKFGTPPVGALNYLEGFILFALTSCPLHIATEGRGGKADASRAALAALFWLGAAWHFLLGVICATGLTAASLVTFPLNFVLLAVIAHERWAAGGGADGGAGSLLSALKSTAPALSLCVVFSSFAFTANMFELDTFGVFWNYDSEFTSRKLKGVRQSAEFTAATDAVVEYLEPRVKKGDFLLAFYDCPMLHYLTDTRAPLRTGYVSRNYPDEIWRGLIRDMVAGGKAPRYAVSCGAVADEPVYEYVRSNYRPVVRYNRLYTVWERR